MWTKLGKLSDEHISYLNEYYQNNQDRLKIVDWWHVKGVKLLKMDNLDDPTFLELRMEMYDLIEDKDLFPNACYILEYYKDSFTTFHTDFVGNEADSSITTVTLIHESDDLVGGKALFRDEDRAVTVLDQNLGDVLSYGHKVHHGVSKVLSGSRRVFINWYKSRVGSLT